MNPGLDKDDKKNYAKALSGFSNSVGGVLIWGIEARKLMPDSPDVATNERPISHLKKFLTDLNSLVSESIIPLNNKVENLMVTLPGEVDKGFIVTYIPESPSPPVRAMLSLNLYFTRVGDSFVMMEHHAWVAVSDYTSTAYLPDLPG